MSDIQKNRLLMTIEPKSDQINYDDVASGPVTVTVKTLREGSKEQPVCIVPAEPEYNGRTFNPCKSMRRVLIAAWGSNGKEWIGKRLTLYGDDSVKFGGMEVGGVRISHLSGIDRMMKLKLTTTRAKRADYIVKPLHDDPQQAQSIPEDATDELPLD